ncbi:MAG: hypothetical protein KC493_15155 [Bacteriovoracaceae bacterium]|nr:hypothetical protein [Bacteriovoracaceae bacterium]
MKILMTVLFTLFAFNTFAQHDHGGDKLVDTAEATTEALEYFKANSNHDDVDDFKGIKAWPVSGGIKVKVYMKTRGDVEYSCHRHSASEPFECHDAK